MTRCWSQDLAASEAEDHSTIRHAEQDAIVRRNLAEHERDDANISKCCKRDHQ